MSGVDRPLPPQGPPSPEARGQVRHLNGDTVKLSQSDPFYTPEEAGELFGYPANVLGVVELPQLTENGWLAIGVLDYGEGVGHHRFALGRLAQDRSGPLLPVSITNHETIIGRSGSEADPLGIRQESVGVSKAHFTVTVGQEGVYITDHAFNGTTVRAMDFPEFSSNRTVVDPQGSEAPKPLPPNASPELSGRVARSITR